MFMYQGLNTIESRHMLPLCLPYRCVLPQGAAVMYTMGPTPKAKLSVGAPKVKGGSLLSLTPLTEATEATATTHPTDRLTDWTGPTV